MARTRARLRVEYLLAQRDVEPPADRCRPALLALSSADRRRQAELDVPGHLLACDFCADLARLLRARRPTRGEPDGEVAVHAGFTGTDLTLIATAVSEIARNIVKVRPARRVTVLARHRLRADRAADRRADSGPGIPDMSLAMRDGYSTYRGLGLGLPGARRLMDDFEIVSEVGRGTTVTMTKWRSRPDDPADLNRMNDRNDTADVNDRSSGIREGRRRGRTADGHR